MTTDFPEGAFDREDGEPDTEFYDVPRLVNHIDDYAIAAVGDVYRRFLAPGGDYLDLMSSWVSHFPESFEIGSLTGLGMNASELSQNPRLNERVVQDLNVAPILPFDDSCFEGVVICVSVQYLARPIEVFSEIGRVLKPGAPLIVTFSNRCFPTKAVRIWLSLDDDDRGRLVAVYAEKSGAFDGAKLYDVSPRKMMIGLPPDPELREKAAKGEVHTDPVYAVVASKKASET